MEGKKIRKINLSDGFLLLWLLMIPTQLGRHFWGEWSSVLGMRIDYLSIILYATDLAWLGWVVTQGRKKKFDFNFRKIFKGWNLVWVIFAAINIMVASDKVVAIYRWARIGQWWWTVVLVKKNKILIEKYLKWIVPAWIVGEALLSLGQVLNAGSIGGILWWLGERRFQLGGIGIAEWSLGGERWIRAYGTFSHPNSLAGFLWLGWWWWRQKVSPTLALDKAEKKNYKNNILRWMVNWCTLMGIFLAGSRTVWVLSLAMLVWSQGVRIKKGFRETIGKILVAGGVICLFLGVININYQVADFVGGWDTNSFKKRLDLVEISGKMIAGHPLFGVGAGNFIVNLPNYFKGNNNWLQPVHNIFLLTVSEIGILGMGLGVIFLRKGRRNFDWRRNLWLIVIVGATGLVDHYWLTLPQNSWLLAVILGVI